VGGCGETCEWSIGDDADFLRGNRELDRDLNGFGMVGFQLE